MVQLKILSGKKAGTTFVARRFPVRIGRAPKANLQLEEDGVWDQHLQLVFNPADGFRLNAEPNALVTVNGQRLEENLLHNGDTLGIGSVRLQFWLSETRQRGLRLREWLTWAAITIISLGQIAAIYFLLHQASP
jgi:pSer/pThr/pTyr-binding forkhead associated (FHA) protein